MLLIDNLRNIFIDIYMNSAIYIYHIKASVKNQPINIKKTTKKTCLTYTALLSW